MKANVSRYIDERLLADEVQNIIEIIVILNGFHCKIHYLASRDMALPLYETAANLGLVTIWCHQVKALGAIALTHIDDLEAQLHPILGRVVAGTFLAWNGERHVCSRNPEAQSAHDEVQALLGRCEEQGALIACDSNNSKQRPYVPIDANWKVRLESGIQDQEANSWVEPKASDHPLVSVIVGVYNKGPFIKECFDSVFTQGVDEVEIICIDDASSDESLEIILSEAKRDARIRVLQNERNLGAGLTRNLGLAEATGRYVMFLDADDLLAPKSLSLLLNEAGATGSDLVRGGIAFYSAGASPALRAVDCPPDRRKYRHSDEPHLWIPWWFTTYLYRRSFLSSRGINFPDLRDGEDPIFLTKALQAAESISSFSNIVYYYRQHGGQKRNNFDYLKHLTEVKRVTDQHDPRIWRDGYGFYVLIHDLPTRIRRIACMAERSKLREQLLLSDLFPPQLLDHVLKESV